ncbi:unnamed protein product [Malus baccata var. baccata]
MNGGHLCVCVCVGSSSFTIIICSLFKSWTVVSFKTVCQYCFKRWSFRVIVLLSNRIIIL